MPELSTVHGVIVGGGADIRSIFQIKDVKLERLLGYKVQHAILEVNPLYVWVVLLGREPSDRFITAPGEPALVEEDEKLGIATIAMKRVPTGCYSWTAWWRRSIPSYSSPSAIFGDKEDGQ